MRSEGNRGDETVEDRVEPEDTSTASGPADAPADTPADAPDGGKQGAGAPTHEAIVEKLRTVFDPEIAVNIYDLGLIYELKIDGQEIFVKASLTSPACPVGDYIMAQIDERIREVPGVAKVEVELTFEPPWDLKKVTEEGREQLLYLGIKV
jgi:metal-sulfur cluster biosynthetic enzyme